MRVKEKIKAKALAIVLPLFTLPVVMMEGDATALVFVLVVFTIPLLLAKEEK